MASMLDDDSIRADGATSAAVLTHGAFQGALVFAVIGAQKNGKIRLCDSVPGDGENDSRRCDILTNGGRI
jgi:hypothetical protein